MDFFLSPKGQSYLPEVQSIAREPSSAKTDALLLGYAMEGVRLSGTFGSYREATVAEKILEDDGRQVSIKPKDRVFIGFVSSFLYMMSRVSP